ncbi:hypothetical protein [uncultured Clostridium sp.]|uniref:hypothetical protein n=1 Tax=uncultured Clostridium sp. TaxID=59620 RepID=UPI00260CAC0D|nr:hypothetical protein [uncultured Clostridium sp.]
MNKIFKGIGIVCIICNLVGCGMAVTKEKKVECSVEEVSIDKVESKEKQNDEKSELSEKAKEINYKKYNNERFGFSIEYPDYLKVMVDPDNGDGIQVGNEDLKLTVSGGYNVLNETPDSMEKELVNGKDNISYKEKGKDFFVASWLEGDMVIYQYKKIGKNMIQGFVLEYDKSKIKEFDPIVNRIYKSFKASNDI